VCAMLRNQYLKAEDNVKELSIELKKINFAIAKREAIRHKLTNNITQATSKSYFLFWKVKIDDRKNALQKASELFFTCLQIDKLAEATLIIETHPKVVNYPCNGCTPLSWAIKEKRYAIVEFLLLHHANVNLEVKLGAQIQSPLVTAVLAASKNSTKDSLLIQQLIWYGAFINKMDEHGFSALHWAAQTLDAACWEGLVENGANPNLCKKDNSTPTPLDLLNSHSLHLNANEKQQITQMHEVVIKHQTKTTPKIR
jgi:ankyrin repeat protein